MIEAETVALLCVMAQSRRSASDRQFYSSIRARAKQIAHAVAIAKSRQRDKGSTSVPRQFPGAPFSNIRYRASAASCLCLMLLHSCPEGSPKQVVCISALILLSSAAAAAACPRVEAHISVVSVVAGQETPLVYAPAHRLEVLTVAPLLTHLPCLPADWPGGQARRRRSASAGCTGGFGLCLRWRRKAKTPRCSGCGFLPGSTL